MATQVLDALGLKCPQPIIKIAVVAPDMKGGETLEVWGDCPTFERDVRTWCDRLNKTVISVVDEGNNRKKIQILF